MINSQLIYNDGVEKCRLIKKNGQNWFVVECKSATDKEAQWMPYMAGTKEWYGLTEEEIAWAKEK